MGLASAMGVFVYASAVAWLGFNSQILFGNKANNFLAPLFIYRGNLLK